MHHEVFDNEINIVLPTGETMSQESTDSLSTNLVEVVLPSDNTISEDEYNLGNDLGELLSDNESVRSRHVTFDIGVDDSIPSPTDNSDGVSAVEYYPFLGYSENDVSLFDDPIEEVYETVKNSLLKQYLSEDPEKKSAVQLTFKPVEIDSLSMFPANHLFEQFDINPSITLAYNADSSVNDKRVFIADLRKYIAIIHGFLLDQKNNELNMTSCFKFITSNELSTGKSFRLSLNDCPEDLYSEFRMTKDIDSILYTSDDLPIVADLTIYRTDTFQGTLKSGNHCHIKTFMNLYHKNKSISIARIPNAEFACFGPNSIYRVNIFFPNMTNADNGNNVPYALYKVFYDKYVREALMSSGNFDRDEGYFWLSTYRLTMEVHRDAQGRIRPNTRVLRKNLVNQFVTRLRELVNIYPDPDNGDVIKNFFFHIHAKNLKYQMPLRVDDFDWIKHEYLNNIFDFERIRLNDFFVDIGYNVIPTAYSMSSGTYRNTLFIVKLESSFAVI